MVYFHWHVPRKGAQLRILVIVTLAPSVVACGGEEYGSRISTKVCQ